RSPCHSRTVLEGRGQKGCHLPGPSQSETVVAVKCEMNVLPKGFVARNKERLGRRRTSSARKGGCGFQQNKIRTGVCAANCPDDFIESGVGAEGQTVVIAR